jgi:hypothetical protein
MGSRFYNSLWKKKLNIEREKCMHELEMHASKATLTDHAAVLHKIRKWSYLSSVVSAQFRFTWHSI